jgi:hypothetical protein
VAIYENVLLQHLSELGLQPLVVLKAQMKIFLFGIVSKNSSDLGQFLMDLDEIVLYNSG